MTREEVLKEVKVIPNRNILLTLPTGFGKDIKDLPCYQVIDNIITGQKR